MADSKEAQFQRDIIDAMLPLGWLTGIGSGYDRATALYTEDALAYFQEAWPERWEKFCKSNPAEPEKAFIQKLVRALDNDGTLNVLRHGFKVPGVKIELCSFKPDHGMNPETQARYKANRLRVVPEVSYSPHAREKGDDCYNPRLDLVLFVNGIPTATLELKSEFKQGLDKAIWQYRKDRPVFDRVTRKPEPLLTFKRGALVHFAVSQLEVAMTTRLAGTDTYFLPFNRGNNGGQGNPPPANENAYATGYLWELVFHPDSWLKILGRFLHLQKKVSENFDGTKKTSESMIFPRYHQWQVVNKLLGATMREGPGERYLIQHSAGSGKSNSIAWAAHQLSALYAEDGSKLFSSVIVVTDRTVLDSQLQNTIYQFEHNPGVVCPITRDLSNKSKSVQLAEALASQTRIIIVTIQTFPALYDVLDKYPQLSGGRYAVIADEAHSSQSGEAAKKLKAMLLTEKGEDEEISAEDLLVAATAAGGPSDRISYYAFTATPKPKTLEIFGRRPNPNLPAGKDNLPAAFHVYSMQQAIEEGFIMDVLQNYTTYNTAWKIAHAGSDDDEVDSKKARVKIGKWLRLHPHNIGQKVQVVVDHFRDNVRFLLKGQAKAIVVCSSRQEAVRYHLAMKEYAKQMSYTDVHPLVAFSGSIEPAEGIPKEVTENSSLLNPDLKGRDLAQAFDTAEFNVLIAANKFQTGFDQPKLCAMYVDKKLHGVDCVQTLSRLNRIFPGKQTYIVDFFNDAEEVLESFRPYYREAKLENVSDPQAIYDLQTRLDEEGIYHWEEVRSFADAFFDTKAQAARLSYHTQPARDRYRARYKYAHETRNHLEARKRDAENTGDSAGVKRAEHDIKSQREEIDRLELFRRNLINFVRLFGFLSQIVAYDDVELEQLSVFARNLYPLLRQEPADNESLDIAGLELTHYRLTKQAEHQLRINEGAGEYGLKPGDKVGTGKPHDPETKLLSEIIEALNDLFGAEVSDEDQLQFLNNIASRIRRQDDVMSQVRHYDDRQVMHGLFPKSVVDTVLEAMNDNEKLSTEVLGDDIASRKFALLVLKALRTESASQSQRNLNPSGI